MRSLAVFTVVVLLASAAFARDIYVSNPAGDDRFTGHQPRNMADGSGPVRTLARALQLAGTGDRVVIAKTDQPFRESISLVGSRHSGYPHQAFRIEGNGATLEGAAAIEPNAWQHDRGPVFRYTPPRMGPQQLFLDGRPAVRVPVDRSTGGLPELAPQQWCLLDGKIYFAVEPGKLPADYALSRTDLITGITLYHVDRVEIVNLTVQGFQADGINAVNTARQVTIQSVTCRGNGRSGIAVGGASRVKLDGCLLGNNGQAQLLTRPYSETVVLASELLSNTAPAWLDQGGRVILDGQPIEGGVDDRDLFPPASPPAQPAPPVARRPPSAHAPTRRAIRSSNRPPQGTAC